jgi:predicted PurR-regulated permease PerM
MLFPPPTAQQARIIWVALTTFAVSVFLAIVGLLCWGMAWAISKLSSVLLPLAIAGVLAYLLGPLVELFQRRGIPRRRAIALVFLIGVAIIIMVIGTILPRVFFEIRELVEKLPSYSSQVADKSQVWLQKWVQNNPTWAQRLKGAWVTDAKASLQHWLSNTAPAISAWFLAQASRVASWFSFVIGLAMVPVYLFYLLLEKAGIQRYWTDYLPVRRSRAKEEIIFIIESINNYLIVFFRGQVLVAICDGILLTIGFLILRMDYAFLLGLGAGVLSIIPFLGVIISLIPATILAAVQFGDWLHPACVLGIFALVQLLEGFVISPKIIGDRVGLHPLTIIIAVMVGTSLLGGLAGGILAIPLTAALRVLMSRYVWKPAVVESPEVKSLP